MAWYWIVLIVYVALCLVIAVLGVFLKPLGGVAKVLITSWKYIFNFAYILLFWWWIAIIRLARHKSTPRVWLFGKTA